MLVRKLFLPLAILIALTALPSAAQAAPIQVTVSVVGAQFYGGQPAFSGQTGVAGLTVSGVQCTGLTNGSAVAPTVPAGIYKLSAPTCGGGTLSKPGYEIVGYTGSAFTVYRATLNVKADNRAKVYGDANPAFGATITGYVNGEDASVVSGSPSLSTTATTSSNVGSYPITVTAGSLSAPGNNYVFAFAPGTLTVRPRAVTVAVAGAQNYGGTPAFSGKTGVAGVTVSGMTCTGLTGDVPITPNLEVGVSYALDPATCSGGVLSNPNYAIDGYTSTSFWVLKAVLTVTAKDAARVYGEANPAFEYTITGFQNDDDLSDVSGAPRLLTGATTASNVGSYLITAAAGTLESTNYRFVFVPGALAVTPKLVTVGVSGAQSYGGAPAFTGRTGVAGVTVSGVQCSGLTGDVPIAPTLDVGVSYALDPATCSGGVLSSSNYAIDGYTSTSFWVLKASLTVTPADQSRVYGFGNRPLTYEVTGFKNGDGLADISGTPALSTTAEVRSDVGTYPITAAVGSLSARNYSFSYGSGTFTVTKQRLVVSADPATRAYGAAPPAYTATFTGFRNGETAAVLTGAPAFSTTATATSDPGSYPLTVAEGTLAAKNYSFGGFNPSTLTVTQGTATITTRRLAGGVLSATITYGAAHTPVAGATVSFTIGSSPTVACTAVTGADGRASCSVAGLVLTQIQLSGYTARFAGTSNLLPGAKYQGIL